VRLAAGFVLLQDFHDRRFQTSSQAGGPLREFDLLLRNVAVLGRSCVSIACFCSSSKGPPWCRAAA
jgi:hypothetical protein